jgi:hypothetical protein
VDSAANAKDYTVEVQNCLCWVKSGKKIEYKMVFILDQLTPKVAIIKSLFDVFIYVGMALVSFLFIHVLLFIARWSIKKPPKMRKDEFIKQFGYSYDYIFLFDVYFEDDIESLNKHQKKYTMKSVMDRCHEAKIETKCFYSCQRDEIYVKLRAPMSRLLAEADRVDYKLRLNPVKLRAAAKAGSTIKLPSGRKVWESIDLVDDTGVSAYDPYDHIYAEYDGEERIQGLYERYASPLDGDISHPLRCVDRYVSISCGFCVIFFHNICFIISSQD